MTLHCSYAQSALSNQFSNIVLDLNLCTQPIVDQSTQFQINGNIQYWKLCTQCVNTLHSPIINFFWSLFHYIWCCFQLIHSFRNTLTNILEIYQGDYIGLCTYLSDIDFLCFFISIWRHTTGVETGRTGGLHPPPQYFAIH